MKYDVVVVGGGPSGLMTASLLKEGNKKLNVLVIEKEKNPYNRYSCGFLNRRALEEFPLLKKYEKKLIDGAPKTVKFISSDFKKEQIYSEDEPLTYLVDRSHFDNGLVEIGKGLGVEFLFHKSVKQVSAGMEGAEITLEGGEVIPSQVLVGADGINGLVASQMGIYESPRQFSLYHGLSMVHNHKDSKKQKKTEPIISLAFEENLGYAFLWPLQDIVQIGVFLSDADKVKPAFQHWRDKLIQKGYLPEEAANEKPYPTLSPAGVALLMERSYEKRTLLVGESGGFVANTTAEGLYPGLYSAKMASQLLLEGFKRKKLDELIPTYSRKWNLEFGEYIQGAIQLHSNLNFLIGMIFSDPRICARYARGFFLGEKVI